jgi:hypothetical protein
MEIESERESDLESLDEEEEENDFPNAAPKEVDFNDQEVAMINHKMEDLTINPLAPLRED